MVRQDALHVMLDVFRTRFSLQSQRPTVAWVMGSYVASRFRQPSDNLGESTSPYLEATEGRCRNWFHFSVGEDGAGVVLVLFHLEIYCACNGRDGTGRNHVLLSLVKDEPKTRGASSKKKKKSSKRFTETSVAGTSGKAIFVYQQVYECIVCDFYSVSLHFLYPCCEKEGIVNANWPENP